MRRKVLFITDQFTGGGAERMLSNIMNNIDAKQFDISLLILYSNIAQNMMKGLSNNVNVICLGINKNHKADKNRILRFKQLQYIFEVNRVIRDIKPDVVFVNKTPLSAKLSLLIPFHRTIKWVARETTADFNYTVKSSILKFIYKHLYFYNHIVGQSDDMINDMINTFGIKRNKFVKINNMVDVDFIGDKANISRNIGYKSDKINLLASGRLCRQKGFDKLIESFAQLPSDNNIKLTIIGQKYDKYNPEDNTKELESLIIKYSLEDKVELRGYQSNPYEWLKESDYFVLSSRYEGFPNVLVEALALGKPCLVNDCPGGIKEIMKEGFNGVVFDFRKGDFESKLYKLINTPFNHNDIQNDIKQRYSIENIIPSYNKLLGS